MKRLLTILFLVSATTFGSGRLFNITKENKADVELKFELKKAEVIWRENYVSIEFSYPKKQVLLSSLYSKKVLLYKGKELIASIPLELKESKDGKMTTQIIIKKDYFEKSMIVLSCGVPGLKEMRYQIKPSDFIELKK